MLEARDLIVRGAGGRVLLNVPNLAIQPSSTLVIAGRTGAGKSLLLSALTGQLRSGIGVDGQITAFGVPVVATGKDVFLLPQDSDAALNPTMRVGNQIAEAVRWRGRAGASLAGVADAVELHASDLRKYPHQLSGGMVQRVQIATTLAVDATIVGVDEPTTGLDPHRAAKVIELLHGLRRPGRTLLIVSHDLKIARSLATDVAVVDEGEIVEFGPAAQVLTSPKARPTRRLVETDPDRWTTRRQTGKGHRPSTGMPVMALRAIRLVRAGRTILDGVDLDIHEGELVGLSGPSGIGKTTLGDLALGLLSPDTGAVLWNGVGQSSPKGRALRTRYLKMTQNPSASIPPELRLRTVFERLTPERHARYSGPKGRALLFDRLWLCDRLLDRTAGDLSGGELQRLALARVILADPVFIVCDEPSSQLDYVVQTEVLDLVRELGSEHGIGVLLISHDRRIIHRYADRAFLLEDGGGIRSENADEHARHWG